VVADHGVNRRLDGPVHLQVGPPARLDGRRGGLEAVGDEVAAGDHQVGPLTVDGRGRLGLAELEAEDRARAAEVAAVLDDARHSYGRFLDTWPVAEDPFTYEARVHLFSRDHNLAEAHRAGFAGAAARRAATVAWFENALLERHFGRTLAASSYRWGRQQRARVEALREPGRRLVSAAGSHLITIASEGRLRALLAVADLSLGRYHRSRP
jgi:hypothetical protein